jgi:hypothetical protein
MVGGNGARWPPLEDACNRYPSRTILPRRCLAIEADPASDYGSRVGGSRPSGGIGTQGGGE